MGLSIGSRRAARWAAFIGAAAVMAACGSSSTTSSSSSSSSSGGGGVPNVGVKDFDSNFTPMSQFQDLTKGSSGLVGVILPDTTSSTRYVDFDAPLFAKAFQAAGYSSSDYKIDNAQGSDATELADAQADITRGAKILVFDPIDSTVGSQIQSYAQQHGVQVISYDRATFTGTNTYYVSFDNVQVGKLIGQGFLDCVKAWNVASPKVFTLDGGQDTDPNAIDFAKGYNSVVWGQESGSVSAGTSNSQGMTLVQEQITPNWVNSQGQTIFQQAFTAHKDINATIEANDGLGNAVIQVLKNAGVPAKKIPTTGQDATLQGMTNVLQGYQCGSVYKPIYLETQATVALATILRAGKTPPTALVNGTTSPPAGKQGNTQPAVLLTPKWVTIANMNSTVIADKFVDAKALCQAAGASACSAAGITS